MLRVCEPQNLNSCDNIQQLGVIVGFRRMPIEEWFDDYQYEVEYDIGESGVKFLDFGSLKIDLGNLPLRYGHHRGKPELRELISPDYEGFGPNQIAVTTGASEANFAVIASLVGQNDHLIVEHPNYPSLYEVPRSLNRRLALLNLTFEEKFKPNLKKLESLITPHTKLVSLTHPNNPTGSIITKKMLCEIVEMVEAHGAYLLVDETYRELSFSRPPPPAATLSSQAISITTMSKAYGLPGIRLGWVAANKHIIESVRAVREQLTICNSAISEEIALAVLRRKQEFLGNAKKRIHSNFRIVHEWMKRQECLEWIPPEGGVVGFPRFKMNISANDFCRLLVEKYKTFVVPGKCFEMSRHFRLGFGGEAKELRSGLICAAKTLGEIAAIQVC
jgi:aspartate/methionine/tyrosine aminotransferase